MSLSPRMFAGLVGGLMLFVGVILLAMPVSVDDPLPSVLGGGSTETACGSVISPTSGYGGETKTLCAKAIDGRRTWGFVLGGVGLVVAAGAAMIRSEAKA